MAKSETKPAALVVVGVGPGLGAALVRRFAREGMGVAIAARRVDKLKDLAAETGGRAYACDATSEISVDDLFTAVERDLGLPRLVVFNAGAFVRKPVVELTPAEIEIRLARLLPRRLPGGSRGRACHAARRAGHDPPPPAPPRRCAAAPTSPPSPSASSASGRSPRAWPASWGRKGIHVGHVIIDGGIGNNAEESQLAPDAIAESYWHLHRQPKSAWTLELDLRPWTERF